MAISQEMEMSDKAKIKQDKDWVDCYICHDVFKRRRETARYCNICEKGFCEGEHGTFEGGKFGICIRCFKGLR